MDSNTENTKSSGVVYKREHYERQFVRYKQQVERLEMILQWLDESKDNEQILNFLGDM